MKNSIIALLGFFSVTAHADGDIYSRYETLANSLAEAAEQGAAIASLQASNTELMGMGVEIMRLYGQKFPECAAQYQDFESKIPTLSSLSVADIHRLYHNGEGLPAAPRTCYLGRSLVVHPAMSQVRLADGEMTQEDKESIVEESLEVAEHVRTVQQRIAN